MQKVFIRVDAYKEIGIGHLTRCLALAEMLKNHFEVTFLCQERDKKTLKLIEDARFNLATLPVGDVHHELEKLSKIFTGHDLLVLDGYQFDSKYQTQVRKMVLSLVVIDDLNNAAFDADLIINHNLHAVNEVYHVDHNTRVIKGADYLLLRPDFFQPHHKRQNVPSEINSVLICMGGADRENLTHHFAQELHRFFPGKITLIVGSAYGFFDELQKYCLERPNIKLLQNLNSPSLIEEMKNHDLLFCTSSMIAAEASVIGTPMILGFMEKNQEKIAELFHQEKLAHSLGNLMLKNFNLEKVIKEVKINEQLTAQSQLIDHQSSKRIVEEFKRLTFKDVRLETDRFFLRPLNESDVTEQYVSWFENEDTKRFIQTAKDSDSKAKLISYVQEKLAKPNVLFLGIFDKSTKQHIGNIKFEPLDWDRNYTIMGILIGEKDYRGKGVSTEILIKTAHYLKEIGLKKMVLGVEKDNVAAIKSYQKVGFTQTNGLFIHFKDSDNAIEMVLDLV